MNRTVTVEIMDDAALRILRELAALRAIRIAPDSSAAKNAGEDELTDILDEIYTKEDSSLDPAFMFVQSRAIGEEDW